MSYDCASCGFRFVLKKLLVYRTRVIKYMTAVIKYMTAVIKYLIVRHIFDDVSPVHAPLL